MASENMVTLTGNLTREPELRFTTGGRGVASFGLAVNRRWQKDGEWQEETSFFNVVAWGDLGENLSTSLQKGSRVTCTGRMVQRSWETPEGEKRSVIELVADDVAASLRWATVQIEKTERTTASATSGYDPGPTYDDQEPF